MTIYWIAALSLLLLYIAVSKLHSNKAPGYDLSQKEHLVYAHPALYDTLANLFYVILKVGYVPKHFGKGIIIPIQKDTSLKGPQKLDNFRGITLCPIISKVFEHCILLIFGDYLKLNDR